MTVRKSFTRDDIPILMAQAPFDFLPAGLAVSQDASPPTRISDDRLALASIDDNGDLCLQIFSEGFTMDDLLEVRDRAEPLIDGARVELADGSHTIALFLTSFRNGMLHLVFELNPFGDLDAG